MKYNKMQFKRVGRPAKNIEMFERIRSSPAKNILILRSEWKLATPPGGHMLRTKIKKNYKVRTLADDSGWYLTLIA